MPVKVHEEVNEDEMGRHPRLMRFQKGLAVERNIIASSVVKTWVDCTAAHAEIYMLYCVDVRHRKERPKILPVIGTVASARLASTVTLLATFRLNACIKLDLILAVTFRVLPSSWFCPYSLVDTTAEQSNPKYEPT
jgi:hypothetical protein